MAGATSIRARSPSKSYLVGSSSHLPINYSSESFLDDFFPSLIIPKNTVKTGRYSLDE